MNETPSEKSFNQFIKTIAGAEIIGDLKPGYAYPHLVADYFFDNRTIVAELKCLEDDMMEKFQLLIDKKVKEGTLSLFYGSVSFEKLLSNMPDDKKEAMKKESFEAVTSSLEDAFEKANKQIRETKKNFNLRDSAGFLILTNNGNITLDPILAVHKLQVLMNKKRNGQVRFESLNFGIYIATRHYMNVRAHQKIYPLITFINDNLRKLNPKEEEFSDYFLKQYAAYKKLPLHLPNLKIQDAMKYPFRADSV